MTNIQTTIRNSVNQIANHPQFKAWLRSERISPQDWVVVNNSFVHRDLSTTKAEYYLVLVADANGKLSKIQITAGLNIKTDFRVFPSRQPNLPKLETLSTAIEDQLHGIGKIVFALIGHIQDDIVIEEEFGEANLSAIAWDPSQKDLFRIQGQRLVVNDPYDEDALWNSLNTHCQKAHINLDVESARRNLGVVLDKLQGGAEARLKLPEKGKRVGRGITDAIVEVLKEQRKDYAAALSRCKGKLEVDPEAFNQVLRISYNFASDAIPYLNLIVSVCDLKPIILWATIGEHYALSEAFRTLPWARSKYKPTLKNYIDIIGDARNSAFHNLFPFQKALRLTLPSDAIHNAELRIFSEYSSRKQNNELTFQDKRLVDILLEFTRARQRPVHSSFWEKNITVMDKTIDLFEATSHVLKQLHTLT